MSVEAELVPNVLGQTRVFAVRFVRAPPGEVVAAGVSGEAEAAGRVEFNCTRSQRHIDEEADRKRHSMNTDRRAPYCVSQACTLLSADRSRASRTRCWDRGTC